MRPKEITIRPVLNGFIVIVGCQNVVFESLAKMTGEITRYYTSPDLIVTDYVKNAVNRLIDLKMIESENCGEIRPAEMSPERAQERLREVREQMGWGADRVTYRPGGVTGCPPPSADQDPQPPAPPAERARVTTNEVENRPYNPAQTTSPCAEASPTETLDRIVRGEPVRQSAPRR